MARSTWMKAAAAVLVACATVHCGGDDEGGSSTPGGSGGGGSGGAAGSAGVAGGAGSAGATGGAAGETGGTGGGGTGGTSGAAGQGGGTPCEQRCAVTQPLACPNDGNCLGECNAAVTLAPWCSDVAENFVACGAEHTADWECDAQGKSVLKAGVCQTEAEASVNCLFAGPAGGMPDLSAACAASCVNMAGLSCVPAQCEQTCNNSVSSGPCAGAAGLVTACGATLTPADFACTNNLPLPSGGKCQPEINVFLACFSSQ